MRNIVERVLRLSKATANNTEKKVHKAKFN